jgi:hypothetical protein
VAAKMVNVQLQMSVHATVVIIRIQRTARIAYQFAVLRVRMGNVQLPTHVHATVVTLKIQRTARIAYQFAVLPV